MVELLLSAAADVAHRPTCAAAPTDAAKPWAWALGKTVRQVADHARANGIRGCATCRPFLERDPHTTECACGHGRHTHLSHAYACALCDDCVVFRTPAEVRS